MSLPAFAISPQTAEYAEPSEVSTTLPVSAGVAYEVFADAVETPRWLPVVQNARVLARSEQGRPSRVAFTGRLERGSVAYTLAYAYDPRELTVTWSTDDESSVRIKGDVRFLPLSPRACMMVYRLAMQLPTSGDWADRHYDGHPASAVVADFREHLKRLT